MGPPRNQKLVEHLESILELRNPEARPGGQRTVYIGLFNALDDQAEINLVGTESACAVILPPIDGVASYSAAMTFYDPALVEAYRQLAASLHSHAGTQDLRTPADVRALLPS